MRVPVSCQIYPPPVSVDVSLLPPLTDAQAACELWAIFGEIFVEGGPSAGAAGIRETRRE